MKRFIASLCSVSVLAACAPAAPAPSDQTSSVSASGSVLSAASNSSLTVAPHVQVPVPDMPAASASADFSVDEAKNLADLQQAYGFQLTATEKDFLSKNKFLIKNVTDTSIRPWASDASREFADLYNVVRGKADYKSRGQQNTVFYTSDVFYNSFNILFTELLKEMENKTFYTSMKDLSGSFYASAQKKMNAASGVDKETWRKVRNYFAVPHALLSTAMPLPTQKDFQGPDGQWIDPGSVKQAFEQKDKDADAKDKAIAFVKGLKMDAKSEAEVLADVAQIYAASGKAQPAVFQDEYKRYAAATNVEFSVDFSQFTPRSHYTGTSLRRQYFRAMNWYIQTPFFLKSEALTDYAFAISQLMAEQPQQLKGYDRLEKMVNFLVGTSDDLMPADYLAALQSAKGKPDQEAAVMDYLVKAKNPKIKAIAAAYPTIGTQKTEDTLLLTKGMRFFSGKFIIDSYWTGMLTQGDEAPRAGYDQKLPPMASSLEVMALLGSDYAKSKIPTLDFYKPSASKAIDQMMAQLAKEKATFGDDYWQTSVYNMSLWAIQGMFSFEKDNAKLPAFMRSQPWSAKTLQTAAGFWTEMRHAVLLYAKQSFAELGGGAPCDDRTIPPPPKGYIEPQLVAYDRMISMSKKLQSGIKEQGFDLTNAIYLDAYVELMTKVRAYAGKELENAKFADGKIVEHRNPDEFNPGSVCVSYTLEGQSDWEEIRNLVDGLYAALPRPSDLPIVSAKDKRAALLADVHTGGDSANPTRILYEGTGVPRVILVAVKDANGPRVAIGFTYSHYEFTKEYGGQRMTDEDWQKSFYTGDEDSAPYQYTPFSAWPQTNSWYDGILKVK